MAQPHLSVVIPAYNEALRIPGTLWDIDKRLRGRSFSYEILVVNDGSRDDTAGVVKALSRDIKNLRLIDNGENKGKGGVVRQGMLAASGQYRLFTDADNSTSIGHFDKMVPEFEKGYDVVIGSRAVRGAVLDPPQPLVRQIPGKLGNLWIQLWLLPGIWDTQCGFKAFTDSSAKRVFSRSKVNGWGFDVEILALAKRLGYRIKEVPVHWVNDPRSHVRFSSYLQVLWETLKIRSRLWTSTI